MKQFLKSFFLTFLILLIVSVSFASGYLIHAHYESHRTSFPILSQAYNILTSQGYSAPPPDPVLEYGMIRGMISAYGDPYTSFAEPAQHELETNTLQGTFGGIGVELDKDSLGFYILYPFTNSPAAQSGIIEGDRLIEVDNLLVSPETSPDEIHAAIRGPVGEDVRVTIARPPDYTETLLIIKRQETTLPSVTWHLEPSELRLGIIQINIIANTTLEEIIKAVDDLRARGAIGYVLDLRNNAGGLLDAGIEISRLFLTSGIIIEQQYRDQPVQTHSVNRPGQLNQIPLVVFVNHNTASAAEIIAGSLQANHRATLIGAPTYGKDSIQLVYDLDDGSSLHITAAHWWIPYLKDPIEHHGLQPDILIDPTIPSARDQYIEAAIDHFFPGN